MRDLCKYYIGQLEKDLAFLFEREGFRVTKKISRGKEHCLVFIESDSLRLKFYIGPDQVDLLAGSPTAPLSWEDKIEGVVQWYSVDLIDRYLRKDSGFQMNPPDEWRNMTLDQQFHKLTRIITRHYKSIVMIFSENSSIHKKADLDEYLETLIRKARLEYEKLARNKSNE